MGLNKPHHSLLPHTPPSCLAPFGYFSVEYRTLSDIVQCLAD